MILEEDLKLGSTGDNVKILQEKLKILGYYNPVVSGNFGIATELGVISFQREYNLEETGIVDQTTWNFLFLATEPATLTRQNYPTLSLNSTGSYVEELQRKLKALLYYTGDITSTFDIETENAVKRFQYNNDLTTTGVVNNTVWNYINNIYGNLNECAINGDTNNNTNNYYTVQSGDTLYSIARRFNTTVDEIKRLNNLTSNTLSIGQQLLINQNNSDNNTNNQNTIYYQVIAGDTLYSIARRFNTTVDEIKRLNNLTSNTLSIGQQLLINQNNTIDNNKNIIYYPVKSGDTLYSIANRFNTTIDNIKNANNLTSNTLSVGQILKIPSTTTYVYYTVQAGDTLYSIARKYNITVDIIKNANNLTNNILSIGQTLRIPI